jgi:LmbE family N-acetylglucosaminyl deacetylase
MKRKEFVQKSLATSAVIGSSIFIAESNDEAQKNTQKNAQKVVPDNRTPWGYDTSYSEVRIERPVPGKPHKGKTLMAIQPHSDDIPLHAAGLVAKLLDEGYEGYLCSVSDDARGEGDYNQNRKDNQNIADFYGMKGSFELLAPHHQMNNISMQDLIQRFIFLFRAFKIDTVISYDPWGHYEENPDHYVTARAVEAARWIAGNRDYDEHFAAGIGPYAPNERYYYSRANQTNNLIVDISNYIDKKVEVNMLNIAKGPFAGGNKGVLLRERLAKEGIRLPILEGDDKTANFNYYKTFSFTGNKRLGEKYGLQYAEGYHYMSGRPWVLGPGERDEETLSPQVEDYIKNNSISL